MAPSEGGRVGKSDVMVSHHPSDSELVDRIIPFLTAQGFSVWHVNVGQSNAKDDRKRGKAVLDTKVFLMVVSQASLTHAPCKDEAALAYISGKQIIPVGVEPYQSLEPYLDSAMKMLLAKLNWTFFINEDEWEKRLTEMATAVADAVGPAAVFFGDDDDQFVSNICDGSLTDEKEFEVEYQSMAESQQRLYVTLRRGRSIQPNDVFSDSFQGLDFWDVHFSGRDAVPVAELADVFVREYGERLANHISDLLRQREAEQKLKELHDGDEDDEHKECSVQAWMRQLLQKDLFLQRECVDRATYNAICLSRPSRFMTQQSQLTQASASNDDFYRRVKAYAIGKLAMLKVFNMNSSVRLVAIQNLGLYETPEIVAGLTELLNDADPNIRTVATLALGRCNSSPDTSAIVRRLLKMMKDSDRLVRQAACISLGHMRAGVAVKTLVHVWRNEPISDVRNAALVALERMDNEEAKIAIKMTRKLEEEVKKLSAPDSIVRS